MQETERPVYDTTSVPESTPGMDENSDNKMTKSFHPSSLLGTQVTFQ